MLSSRQIFVRSQMGSDYRHLPGGNVQSGDKHSSRLIQWLSRNSPDGVHSVGDNLDWWSFLSDQLSCRNRKLKTIVIWVNRGMVCFALVIIICIMCYAADLGRDTKDKQARWIIFVTNWLSSCSLRRQLFAYSLKALSNSNNKDQIPGVGVTTEVVALA